MALDQSHRPAAVVAPPDRVAVRRRWVPIAYGPGTVLGALGAVGIVISLFMSWRIPGVHPVGIPVDFLWNHSSTSADPSLLIFLIPIAVVAVVGVFVPFGGPVRFLAGLAMLVVAGVFAYQLDRVLYGIRSGAGDLLDTGFYVGAIGAFLALVSGVMPSVWVPRGVAEPV